MRKMNRREVRRCAGGELTPRTALGIIGGLVAAGVLLAASPAVASRPPAQGLVAARAPQPGLGDNVFLYHPILASVPQKPPLEPLIRFRTEEYTSFVPQAFHMVVHLMWWHRGRWTEILPSVTYGLADLQPVGQHDYLNPAEWTCRPGRFYVRVHIYGITHQGRHQTQNLYFPFARFNRKHPDRGNPFKPPSLRQAWKTSCQGHDTLIG